jgi:ribonuclease P protein component
MSGNDEEDFSTQHTKKKKDPRVPGQDEEPGRSEGHQEQAGERQKKNCRLMRESLAPRERIRKKKDFLFLYKKGKRYKSTYFTLICLTNGLGYSRVGVVASKKIGNAVIRNRAKRRMRELFRRNKSALEFPVDLVMVSTAGMTLASWAELRELYLLTLKRVFEKKRER